MFLIWQILFGLCVDFALLIGRCIAYHGVAERYVFSTLWPLLKESVEKALPVSVKRVRPKFSAAHDAVRWIKERSEEQIDETADAGICRVLPFLFLYL